jgi:hypothetical protein
MTRRVAGETRRHTVDVAPHIDGREADTAEFADQLRSGVQVDPP